MKNKNQSYYNEQKIKLTRRLREILYDFPDFALDFFTGIEPKTSALTRINYAYDIRTFFNWALTETNLFRDKTMYTLEVKDLEVGYDKPLAKVGFTLLKGKRLGKEL